MDVNNDLALVHTNPLDAERFEMVKITGSEWSRIRIKSNRQVLGVLQSTGTVYVNNPEVSGNIPEHTALRVRGHGDLLLS